MPEPLQVTLKHIQSEVSKGERSRQKEHTSPEQIGVDGGVDHVNGQFGIDDALDQLQIDGQDGVTHNRPALVRARLDRVTDHSHQTNAFQLKSHGHNVIHLQTKMQSVTERENVPRIASALWD